ncbi:MAG TPA: aspartyl protease family protein [Candidatus Udaeobacter sp.]|nr:aspartyl protease family protein [Candidatus Udaeobacter sp.]
MHAKLPSIFLFLSTSLVLAQGHPATSSTEDVSVPAAGESVPMLDFGGRPVVEVMINNKGPYRFILDTGASVTAIDTSVAADLSLDDAPKVQELRIGNVVVHNLAAFVNPISQMLGSGDVPRGVLSASAFPGSLVSFDYSRKQITFRKGTLPEPNDKQTFNYDPADLPSVPVTVAGREITVHLDTGAPYTLALPTKYMKEIPLSHPAEQKGHAKTHVGLLPIYVATLDGDISIGDFKLPTHELRFTDVVPFGSAEPKGQFGAEGLQNFVLTLDSLNHRVRFEPVGTK